MAACENDSLVKSPTIPLEVEKKIQKKKKKKNLNTERRAIRSFWGP